MAWGSAYGDPYAPAATVRATRGETVDRHEVARGLVERALCMIGAANTQRLGLLTGLDEGDLRIILEDLEDADRVRCVQRGGRRLWRLSDSEDDILDLPPGAARLLDAVEAHPGAPAAKLAELSGLQPSEVSRHGTLLESKGHLVRVHAGRYVHYMPART